VEEIFHRACAAESRFAGKLWTPEAAIAEAMRLTKRDSKPVILADAQDNPGAGGSGDTTGILDALLHASPPRAALGILRDGDAARAAHAVGRGATIVQSLGAGGRSVPWVVEALGDGNMRCTGPMLGGMTVALGPMALLRHEGVSVVVAPKAVQALDAAPFAHLGVDLATFPVVVLKSAVHFRAQFEPMSQATLCVVSPGAFIVDTSKIPFARLRPEIRRVPIFNTTHPRD
jgi:microcystin degradation protein MlrC